MRTLLFLPALALTACDVDDLFKKIDAPEPFSACEASEGDGYEYGGFDLDTGGGGAYLSIDGDTLSVDVSYGGGCENHEWVMCWPDQSFLESKPVQAHLEVWHGIDSDVVCDAYLSETVTFDLTPLKEQYQAGYRSDSGSIILHVGEDAIEYTF